MEKTKKPVYKRWWFIAILVIVVIAIAASVKEAITDASAKNATYTWPDSALASMIPQPESRYGRISIDSDSSFIIDVYKITKDEYENYVGQCRDRGYIVDYTREDDAYAAEDENGYSLRLYYDGEEKTLRIDLTAPKEEIPEDGTELSAPAASVGSDSTEELSENSENKAPETEEHQGNSEDTDAEAQGDSGQAAGIRPEFKEMLDDYEEFMAGYCDFMVTYADAGEEDTASMLMDYLALMEQELEWVEKIEALEDEEMNEAELAYYTEVTLRVTKKLAGTSVKM